MQLYQINIATSYQEVFQQLEKAILQGNIKIGEPIPTEAELSRVFGVKRSSVREGIRLLEQSGLVVRGAGRRLIVTAPATDRTSENFIRSARLRDPNIWTASQPISRKPVKAPATRRRLPDSTWSFIACLVRLPVIGL